MLSKYVLALLKKDMPYMQLKAHCVESLSEFLSGGAQDFVTRLFDAVDSGLFKASYENQGATETIHEEDVDNVTHDSSAGAEADSMDQDGGFGGRSGGFGGRRSGGMDRTTSDR